MGCWSHDWCQSRAFSQQAVTMGKCFARHGCLCQCSSAGMPDWQCCLSNAHCVLQVNLSELDGDMVALAGLQRECQEALRQRAAKSQELTQVHKHWAFLSLPSGSADLWQPPMAGLFCNSALQFGCFWGRGPASHKTHLAAATKQRFWKDCTGLAALPDLHQIWAQPLVVLPELKNRHSSVKCSVQGLMPCSR